MVASFPMELGARAGNRWPPRGNLAISCSFPKRGSRVSDPGDRDTVLRLYAFAFTGRIGTPQCDEQAGQGCEYIREAAFNASPTCYQGNPKLIRSLTLASLPISPFRSLHQFAAALGSMVHASRHFSDWTSLPESAHFLNRRFACRALTA